jgi:hypothetical protein
MSRLLLALLAITAWSSVQAGEDPHHNVRRSPAFDRLTSLVGVWHGKDEAGNTVTVSYRIVSDSSALMETMDMGADKSIMITMYHPDGDATMATHYCSMGNQPRMKCTALSQDGNTLSFSYVDATNLAKPDADRMEHLTVVFRDRDHFAQEWSARMNGELGKPSVFEYTRGK